MSFLIVWDIKLPYSTSIIQYKWYFVAM